MFEHFSDKNKLSSNVTEFVMKWNLSIGVSTLPTVDLSLMELRGRSTTSKNLEEDNEDDNDEDDSVVMVLIHCETRPKSTLLSVLFIC